MVPLLEPELPSGSWSIKEVVPSRICSEELLKKMTKYAFTSHAKFESTCKSHEKWELHIHNYILYSL